MDRKDLDETVNVQSDVGHNSLHVPKETIFALCGLAPAEMYHKNAVVLGLLKSQISLYQRFLLFVP